MFVRAKSKMADNVQSSMQKLNDQNYTIWKFKMQLVLSRDGLWGAVSAARPTTDADGAWAQKNEKAKVAIGLALDDSQLLHVMRLETAKEMWDTLQDYHERSSLTGKIHIWRTLYTTRLSEGGSMAEHLNELTALRLRLTALGEEVSDSSFVAAMLASLPKSYEGLLVALESRPDKDLTVDFVKGRLLDEGRRRRQEEARDEKALVSSAVSDKKSEKKKKEKVCYYCKKEGHFKRDCKKWAAEQKKESAEKAKVAVLAEDSDVCLLAGKAEEGGVWYFDSGATSHMTNDASILEKLDGSSESTILLADGKSTKAVGMGTGRLISVDGDGIRKNVTLANVYHVPSLAGNLLSVSKIADLGFEVVFDKAGCKVLQRGKVVLIGVRKGGLYHLKQIPEQALLAGAKHGDSCLHLWHRRLGHRDPEAVLKIVRDGLGHGLKLDRCDVESVCGSCCEGKMSRGSFPKKSTSRATAVGELVHTDLGGPMEVETPHGNRFFMTMVDDYSRYTVVYLLPKKSDAAERIREYCSLVKNQFGNYPKAIRSDGGGEYSSTSLKKFFADNGIVHEQTAPYSPQQNGVAERRNRYAVESVRCMLAESGLGKTYWGEAICTAIYLQNRLPSSSVDSTPFELWHGKKPSYGHLRIFGSQAYVHVPKEKRRKLDMKSEKLVFVGYAEGRKAYRFVNLMTECITVSRDAKFLELCTVKEAVKQVAPKAADTVSVPLVLPPAPEEQDEDAGTTPAGSDGESEPDLEATQYESASDGEQSFHGFPLDEIARRSKRSTKGIAPVRLIEEAYATAAALEEEIEPRTLHEAITCREKEQWNAAMLDELKSHSDNGTWDLVELPTDRKAVGSRWVYKLKRNSAGQVTKYKARLVAQGYSQKFGQDYDEVFAPVTSHTTLRVLLALASRNKMVLKHFDVKTAYLYGELDQILFMKQPPGYEVKGKEHYVCRLKKSIYGLKQSARCWNQKLDGALQEMGFKPSSADHCLYLKVEAGKRVFLLIYVDDIMVGAEDEKLVDAVYDSLKQKFEITNLGDLNFFLGMEIGCENGNYSVCLSGYIDRVVEKFGLCDAKGAKTPMEAGFVKVEDTTEALPDGSKYRSLVGVLLYIAVCARPDIAVSAAILGRKVEAPTQADYVAAKRVVRYLKATRDWRLVYSKAGGGLIGYTDADWAGDVSTRKSTSGYAFCYGGGAVSWASRKQACVTLSSMESEYVALSEASQELIWLRGLLEEMGDRQEEPTRMLEDNQSCIKFVGSERSSRRSKHIETREHFVKELCDRGVLKLEYCATDEMAADVLTKPLGTIKQRKFSAMLGLSSNGGNRC